MLSPREDDDDDTHLCIKCNRTIVGLDNYVKHRKERCGKKPENKSDLPPIESLDPTYSLGADVFFQSLELQSSVKKTSLSRLTPPIPISKSSVDRKTSLVTTSTSREARMSPLETNLRGEDWIGGHTLRISSHEDNQTKLINAVASISGTVKKETSSYTLAYNDYKPEDESEESDVSEDDEEEEHAPSEKWKPPPNYTGGKWRPASPDHDWDDQEHTTTWKTLLPEVDRDEDYDAPPPGHTKGKWVPGANEKTQIMQTTIQTKGSVQYWCGPCNRRLGSRAVYDKHLRSSLHLKKVLPEHELEFSGHLEPMKIAEKRVTRPSKFVDGGIYSQLEGKKKQKKDTGIKVLIKKRKRKSTYVHCAGCKSRVREHLMGKHLISHYHFRKATGVTNAVYQQLILDNIDAVVHQSPFQCSPCKFYTNWISNFLKHWESDEHKTVVAATDGIYWCSFCKFECESSQEMLDHISSSDHKEVVAVINRSMPIIIRKKTEFKCSTCSEIFRYNIEMRKHSEKTGHPLSYSATDIYQELHKCQQCTAKFKSSLTLAAHLKSKHKQKPHLCLVCKKTFESSGEAKRHRQSSEHRINRKEMLIEKGVLKKDLSKKCPYCFENVVLKNVLALKEHIRSAHPDIRKTCPKCGMEFIFPQEVSFHIRTNACQYQESSRISSSVFWNCSQCLFATDSQAECYFHEILHDPPVRQITKIDGKEKVLLNYPCPICFKVFRKASLREHLRQHTFERPFVCSVCRTNFTRQTSLNNHVRCEHGDAKAEKGEKWTCDKCTKTFSFKSLLTRHTCVAATKRAQNKEKSKGIDYKCEIDDCIFVTASAQNLSRHQRIHGIQNKQRHKCPTCSYKCNQASHMKRHLMSHKGSKPYCCPHCEFTCGSLENLRKHVLRSGRHKNVFLYTCSLCEYKTNMATELRVHLITIHADKYNSRTAMEAAKTHLMTTDFNKKTDSE